MKYYSFFTIVLFALTATSNAQSLTTSEIEDDLVHKYSDLLSFRDHQDYDSINYQDSVFRNTIAAYTQEYPSTLIYPFNKLTDSCKIFIVTSPDSLFRIYSWDTWIGGTMHDFNNVFQYKSGKNVYSKVLFDSTDDMEGDPLSFYSGIFTLNTNNKVYYLAINNGIYSTKDAGQSIKVFCIENNMLNDTVQLIKTASGIKNQVTVEYDFFSVAGRPERPVQLIKYDAEKRRIYIPVVLKNGEVTNSFIRYQFTGKYFQKL